MKRIYFNAGILLFAILLTTGCASRKQGKWLDSHYQLLQKAANSKISPEEKLDILANSYTTMMHQSLNFVNPKKGVKFAKEYTRQNEKNIEKILKELGTWRKDMGTMEHIAFGLKMTNKPYAKDLVDLFPRFKRKFKLYSKVISLSGKVGKGLIGLGGRKLGL